MNPIFKEHLISGGITFLTAFIVAMAGTIAELHTIEFTNSFLISLILTGVRAGIKELLARYAPKNLGGRK